MSKINTISTNKKSESLLKKQNIWALYVTNFFRFVLGLGAGAPLALPIKPTLCGSCSCISGAITHQVDHQGLLIFEGIILVLADQFLIRKQEIILMITSVEMMMTTSKSSLFQRVKIHFSFASVYHFMCEMNLAKTLLL